MTEIAERIAEVLREDILFGLLVESVLILDWEIHSILLPN
jgi:hypothetical protein